MSAAVRLLVIAVLAALIAGLYSLSRMIAAAGGILAPVPNATVVGTRMEQRAPDLLEVRLHYCDGGRTYTMLSMPRDASFDLRVATDSESAEVLIPATGLSIAPAPIPRVESDAPSHALGEDACAVVGTAGDRKLVLCRGKAPARFTITVSDALASRAYSLSLAKCGTPRPEVTP